MTEQYASVTVQAPVEQVYSLFTHFDDFPKFMRFIKEVTYLDERRTHWVAHVLRDYEWIALNEDWIPNQQVGWRSVSGLKNTGKVKFSPLGANRTMVSVYISYTPPTGPLGAIVDHFSTSEYFATVLRQDLDNFARMVEQAPPGALDPMSSHYLFHATSAVAEGHVTDRQKAAMARDPRMSSEALAERRARVEREESMRQQEQAAREAERRQRLEWERKTQSEREVILAQERVRRLQEERARAEAQALLAAKIRPPDHVLDTIGGRNASIERTAAGDRDGLRHRFIEDMQDPMTSRYPSKSSKKTVELSETEEIKRQSTWFNYIRGSSLEPPVEQ